MGTKAWLSAWCSWGHSSPQRRWARLYPWCRLLRGLLSVEYGNNHDAQRSPTAMREGELTIVLTLPVARNRDGDGDSSNDSNSHRNGDASTTPDLRDALELVALALVLDGSASAWRTVLVEFCNVQHFHPQNHTRAERVPRFRVVHTTTLHDTPTTDVCADSIQVYSRLWVLPTLTRGKKRTLAKRYLATRQWLLATCGADAHARVAPITLTFDGPPDRALPREAAQAQTEAYCARLLTFLRSIRQQGKCAAHEPPRVARLCALSVDLSSASLTATAGQTIQQIVQAGFRVDALALPPCGSSEDEDEVEDEDEDEAKDKAHCALVHALAQTCAGVLGTLIVYDAKTSALATTLAQLRNISGLRGPDTIELRDALQGSGASRRLKAMRLAWALLDRRSPTSVRSFRMPDGNLLPTDLQAMHELLTCQDPVELLHRQRLATFQGAAAAATATVISTDHPDSSEEADMLTATPSSVKVTHDTRLQSLELRVVPLNEDSIESVLQVLRCVGGQLRSLTISLPRWQVGQDALAAILAACPQLTTFRLHGAQLASLQALLHAYRKGRCRIQALHLDDLLVVDKQSCLTLVRDANVPQSGVYHCLRTLELNFYLNGLVIDELLRALHHNVTLTHIGVRVTGNCMALYRSAIQRLHLAPLPLQAAPLDAAQQRAFLSVLPRATATAALGVMPHLPADLCAIIFSFAAENELRRIVCHVHDWVAQPHRFEI